MQIAKAVRWAIGCGVGLALVGLLGMGQGGMVAQANATVGNGQVGSCTEASLTTALAQGGLINFSCGAATVTIPITSRKLINQDTTLDSTGLEITLDGNAARQETDGIFEVASGVTLNIKGINFLNGQSTQPGAAIYGHTGITLTVSNSLFLNNVTTIATNYSGGGAISLDSGSTAQITNSNFNYNKGPSGGAINSNESNLIITGSSFNGNQNNAIYSHSGNGAIPGGLKLENSQVLNSSGSGIAISYAVSGVQSAVINNTVIANNTSGYGGGIFNDQANLKITNSLLNNNYATLQGGALWSGDNALVNVTNTTFTNNTADPDHGQGGAIFRKNNSTLNLTNTTIAANVAGLQGGGLDTDTINDVSNLSINNSIIANNTAYRSSYFNNCTSSTGAGAYNLQWPALNNPSSLPCLKVADLNNPDPTILKIADPKLANLADAGGPTRSVGLLEGSGALDSLPTASCPATDQRGVARPVGTACDIGAFEGIVRPPTLTKIFSPAIIGLGGTSKLFFMLSNSSTTGTLLTGISFSDSLPATLLAANPTNLSSTCTSTGSSPILSVTGGGSILDLTGISLATGQSCLIGVDVTSQATTPGSVTNSVTVIAASATGLTGINAQAVLTVTDQAPHGLTAIATSNSQINLSWQNAPANNLGFRIERSANDTAHYGLIATVGANVTSYQDKNLGDGTTYYYRVAALTSGGLSPYSNVASATTTLSPPMLTATSPVSATAASLSWQDSGNYRTGYRLERSATDTAHFQPVITTSATARTYQDNSLSEATLYYYRLAALTTKGDSPYSNVLSLTTPLSSPISLTAVLSGTNAVSLTWVNTSQKQSGFHLEYRQGISGTWQTLADTPGTTYLDSGVVTGTLRLYRVRAYNSSLVSAYSNQASLVIPGRWVVTEPNDSGDPNAAGTLSYALAQAAASSDKTISFQLTSGYTVTVQSGVTLPVAPGVMVGGSCGPTGPGLVVAGGQWQLQGQAALFGLSLSGNGQVGPRITNRVSGQARGGNYLSCVVVKS